MGYGLGVLLIVIGAIFVFALNTTSVGPLELQTLGYILIAGGAAVVLITAVQLNARRRHSAVSTTTHPDGSQSVRESQRDTDPPAPMA